MKRFKVISCLLILVMLAGIMTACKGDSKETTTSATTTTAKAGTTTAAATEPTTTEEEIPNFNREGFPIVNEPITLTMLSIQPPDMIDDWTQHKFFQRA